MRKVQQESLALLALKVLLADKVHRALKVSVEFQVHKVL